MMPRRLRIAILLAFVFHGFFILTARYRLSYDAFTHMLFANHYAESWFSLWEARWYTGFTVVSYPPLIHQLIAIFIPLLGFEKAFAIILWVVTSFYPLGVYAFSRIFTGKTSSSYAALASAILLPIFVTAHIFGQLPFLAGTLLALFSAASLNRYLRDGGLHNFLLTVSLYTTTMASHHATLIVQPFLILAVVLSRWSSSETYRDQRVMITKRLLLISPCIVLFSYLVVFPFWQWGAQQAIQTPIDHLSRHNFLTDPLALAIFFFPMYGPMLLVIPLLIRRWQARFIGLLISFITLFILGLGGTTSLPRFLFGASWEWLTYDRFAFWATLTSTPFFGILFIGLKKKYRFMPPFRLGSLRMPFFPALTFSLFATTAIGSWFTPILFPIQPDPIDMQPIVDFLNAENRSQYRYLTFGFGDQFAYLNLLTKATTIDGSYHTARELPELRESGIGQVDTVYWAEKGVNAIEPILQKSGAYGVRWGFVNPMTVIITKLPRGSIQRSPFVPLLEELGWEKIETLANGVVVYENPAADLPESFDPPATKPFTEFAWGVLPILSLITTLSLAGLRIYPFQTERIIRALCLFVVSLIPLALCFWLYQPAFEFPHPRVYFTYTDALFFLTDALVLLAVILWALTKLTSPTHRTLLSLDIVLKPSTLVLALALLSFLSSFWSTDWRISVYISFHLILLFLFILSLRDHPDSWKLLSFGLCAALTFQVITGYIGFALQSTSFLSALNMNWPGVLDPSTSDASVVQLQNGLRILRAYGTFPHPNILGGFALVALLGPASIFLTTKKPNYPALILFSLGTILLAITFSRSAWLGYATFLAILTLKAKHIDRKRLTLFITATILTLTLTFLPLRQVVEARTTSTVSHAEEFSFIGRAWLTQEAIQMIRERPLTGYGIGSFITELSKRAGEGYIIEPVHNIFLLAGAELGLSGILLLIGLSVVIAICIVKVKTPQAILASGILSGLGVISLFDHYLWTLAPGRVLLALVFGLWLGAIEYDA